MGLWKYGHHHHHHHHHTRIKANKKNSRAYTSINPKTRAILGLGIITWAGIGLYVSDKAEEKFGFTPSEEEKRRLEAAMPRVIAVEPVEKK